MEIEILQKSRQGDRPHLLPILVRQLLDEMSGLDRVLTRRELEYGQAIEKHLFPSGAPPRVMPADVRHALASRLEGALRMWIAAPVSERSGDVDALVKPLRAIAENVRGGEADDAMNDYLFPTGVPPRVTSTELLRAFRTAASREKSALVRVVSLIPPFESWETVVEHEIAGRMVLVTKLWVVALRWYALAAARVDAPQAASFGALLEKWQQIELATRQMIDA